MTSFSTYKQRGIYSEVVNPENATSFGAEIKQGPNEKLVIHVNQKQKMPKAFSILKKENPDGKRRISMNRLFKPHTEISTVDPKVMEPYDPIPGRVPRKVAIDRKKKEYASFDIEHLLKQEGIDYNNPFHKHVDWLPLELFDDTTFDDYSNIEWVKKAEEEHLVFHALTAKGLYKNEENSFIWRPILIHEYDYTTQRFNALWKDPIKKFDNERFQISRINFVLDAEDPRKFAKRVYKAYLDRVRVDSMVRYNYYIDNMPVQNLYDLDAEQKKRLEALCKTKKLESFEQSLNPLLNEANVDYQRTMNKIIFNKYLESNKEALEDTERFPVTLEINEKTLEETSRQVEENIPYFGMVQLEKSVGAKDIQIPNFQEVNHEEPKEFTEIFKDFCFASLYIKEEVITALQEIRLECNKVLQMNLFNFTELPPIMHLEEFKHIQESATYQMCSHLKVTWVSQLISIIKEKFSGVGKGWFNMKETNKLTYDFGKLKRFLTVVRLNMQDTLLALVRRCYFEYFNFLNNFVPKQVIGTDNLK